MVRESKFHDKISYLKDWNDIKEKENLSISKCFSKDSNLDHKHFLNPK